MDFQEFFNKNLDQKILKNFYWEFIPQENKIKLYFPHYYYKEYFVINFLKSLKKRLKKQYKIELIVSNKKKEYSLIKSNFKFYFNYDISTFFYTQENQLIVDTILKIINNEIIDYNPIIIYGLNNSGKTHLLRSIGNLYLKNKCNYKIFYLDLKNLNYINFKNYFFKHVYDVLLLDNIQEISYNSEKLQISLLNLLNKYILSDKIVYVTTNKKIINIKNLNSNLISLLNGGLILKLKLPNFYTKIKYIEFFCKKNNLNLSHSEIFEIAVKHKTIADIKIYLYRILANSNLKKEKILLTLKKNSNQNIPKISSKKIIETVAKHYGVTPKQIISNSQKKNIVTARHIAIYLCKDLLKLPSVRLAKIFNRDHSTILYSFKKINNLKKLDSNFDIMLKNMSKKCTFFVDFYLK